MRLSRSSMTCAIAGLALAVAGFVLPAVRFPPDPRPGANWGPGAKSSEFPGWICAEITLAGTLVFFQRPSAEAIPAVVSGWINPLVLFYLLLWATGKLRRILPFIAGGIVVCSLLMWIQLAKEHVTLLIGHYLWIAGIALILCAPFAAQLTSRSPRGEATASR